MKHLFITKLLLLLILVAGCGHDDYSWSGYESAKDIDYLLRSQKFNGENHLKILSKGLSHDFFFYGSFIPSLRSGSGHSLKGKVVYFKVVGNNMVMLEKTTGHLLKDFQNSPILLAEFPILETASDGYIIDFAKGMTSAFITRNIGDEALNKVSSDTAPQFKSMPLTTSFIDKIENKRDIMTISQIAQWRNEKAELLSGEIRYYFREYLPKAAYKKVAAGTNRHVGYFNTPLQVQDATTKGISYLVKWDLEKPIVFFISSNTPERFVKPITDGILYWNHIFGREIFQVKRGDKDLKAPDPNYNIIQWVNWDNESSAYADLVVDHLTGQVLQAQVYFRSGWIVKTKQKLRANLASQLKVSPIRSSNELQEQIAIPNMFDVGTVCGQVLNEESNAHEVWHGINHAGLSEAAIDKLTEDIVTGVTAHEMGHILGLRHNMAASTFGDFSYAQHKEALEAYLGNNRDLLGQKRLIPSVMDVLSVGDDALSGHQIRSLIGQDISASSLKSIFTYDAQAVSFGYNDTPMIGDVPFCTDEHLATFLDCQRWDESNQPALAALKKMEGYVRDLAISLAEVILEETSPNRPGKAMALRDIPLGADKALKTMEKHILTALGWFHEQARAISVEYKLPALGSHNILEVQSARFSELRKEIVPNGGASLLFSLIPPYRTSDNQPEALAQVFFSYLKERMDARKKKLPDWNFSDTDEAEAHAIALKMCQKLLEEYFKKFTQTLSKVQFDDPEFQEPIEEALGKIAEEIILRRVETNKDGSFPQFAYAQEMREKAVLLLSPRIGKLPDWSYDSRERIGTELKKIVEANVKTNSKKINPALLARDARGWLFEQNQILQGLLQIAGQKREKK